MHHLTSRLCKAKMRSPWQPSGPLIDCYELTWISILAAFWNVWSSFFAEDHLVVVCIPSSFWIWAATIDFFVSPPMKACLHFIVAFGTLRNRNWLTALCAGWCWWCLCCVIVTHLKNTLKLWRFYLVITSTSCPLRYRIMDTCRSESFVVRPHVSDGCKSKNVWKIYENCVASPTSSQLTNDNKSCPKHTCITGIRWDAAAGLQRGCRSKPRIGGRHGGVCWTGCGWKPVRT